MADIFGAYPASPRQDLTRGGRRRCGDLTRRVPPRISAALRLLTPLTHSTFPLHSISQSMRGTRPFPAQAELWQGARRAARQQRSKLPRVEIPSSVSDVGAGGHSNSPPGRDGSKARGELGVWEGIMERWDLMMHPRSLALEVMGAICVLRQLVDKRIF